MCYIMCFYPDHCTDQYFYYFCGVFIISYYYYLGITAFYALYLVTFIFIRSAILPVHYCLLYSVSGNVYLY